MRRRGAEVSGDDSRVEELHDGSKTHTTRHLVLVDGRASRDGVVHQLLKRPVSHHSDLQRPDRVVRHSALAVNRVERLLHGQAASVQHMLTRRVARVLRQQLPVYHIMAGNRLRVGVARVLHHTGVEFA